MRSRDTFTSEQRRAQLVDAAIVVIAENGYPAASIARIAEHVGIAKSVALYHFRTKDELVAAVTTAVFAAAAGYIVPAIAAAGSATEKLAAYIRSNAAFLAEHREQTIALREIATTYRSADGRRFDEVVTDDATRNPPQGELALLDPAAIFALGVDNGEFRADLDPVRTGSALRGALDGAATDHARLPDYDPIAYGETVVDLFTRAVIA
ncbi:Transcriptional regulator, TetR family OS=Tsukamurella paurometabola (strain ATCC 8368 / DSM/ CCUG 35730 / CIP 100753 / JCM 10117 / KCTC 9821 / NBRC 16120/ NCIMB 702349 / NCTC 13040) OX=521096 GN=Tpau_2290 PE=4 SV=1 [Tsukamurella paurometabola]|uniref:Transcriptional regulator, TetR family n=1 Tax=Tsukamurella paurometabola (strain ATCC 8368 / DSM 20162 / CCUG 35730 / CIP 100753 / JCM 10117 / KCTC 9821 / NBRC 16120 / NCIMB 702349 / NCTC 13040) TaxID=521096 RepID=D5UQC7_TSUPD|nr:helix-turn-helix domain-containing protein [Tsukamurella paurometabola]ADG78897.1 transcriptional regulator, TetR family [Tsukamurella paurometabola DSM 20162]SUP33450.1 Fatty acid metabolism regulator protein [Tsukamurella paurometabola]